MRWSLQPHLLTDPVTALIAKGTHTCRETVARGYVTPRNSARGPSRASVCLQQASTPEKPCPGCSAKQAM